MANKVINTTKLEMILQSRWTEFIDKSQLMRTVLEHVRDSSYKTLKQNEFPRQLQMSVLFRSLESKTDYVLEAWVEFTVPKDDGSVIGTHVYTFSPDGFLQLKESYGTHFLPETS